MSGYYSGLFAGAGNRYWVETLQKLHETVKDDEFIFGDIKDIISKSDFSRLNWSNVVQKRRCKQRNVWKIDRGAIVKYCGGGKMTGD